MEEDNVRKKLSFEDIQEDDKEEEKDETMEDAGDNPAEVPLPLSDDEEETDNAFRCKMRLIKGCLTKLGSLTLWVH